MPSKLNWYGVKTLYRAAPVGRARGTDGLYSVDVTLVEERVIVVRARTGDDAIRMAEVEAKKYATKSHHNPYGQRVRTRYLGYVDAYHMFDELHEGAEVFSETEVVSRKVSDRAIVHRQIGRDESRRRYASRRNILDIAFQHAAPGVRRSPKDQALFEKVAEHVRRRDA
jgi:uncharacterized protein DUF4288